MATAISLRQERRALTAALREQSRTWVEIATIVTQRYGVNRRAAFRLAHDWSQREAADAWNDRWPDDPKTFKNFSYWEQWPAATGYAPSMEVLARLAELYQCSAADLVADCADFRTSDSAHRARTELVTLEQALTGQEDSATNSRPLEQPTAESLVNQLDGLGIEEMATAVRAWMSHTAPSTQRQDLLLKMAAALSLAASTSASPFGDDQLPELDADSHELSGVWLSRYTYYSSGRAEELHGEHRVQVRRHGNRLVGRSESGPDESRLKLNLSVTGAIATGTWTERTSLGGYYGGATYHGTLQLIISPQGRSMSGRWLGFDKEFKVNTGEWQLEWIEEGTPVRKSPRQI